MGSITISALIEGGNASLAPPLGPSLSQAKVNVSQVVAEINEKTKSFAGMQVPVKVIIDPANKSYSIEVGLPPTAALIKKEIGIKENVKETPGEKGKKVIGNITIAQLKKVAEQKTGVLLSKTVKSQVMEISGTCLSLGVTVEGLNAKDFQKQVKEGKFDSQLKG